MTGIGQMSFKVDEASWDQLAKAAWKVRENAHLVETGKTKVGSAVLCPNGQIYAGCNVQNPFKSHIHAEVSAITSMVAAGERRFIAILIVSDQRHFTPCGDCRDWIMAFGGSQAAVGAQWEPNGGFREKWSAAELMPHPKLAIGVPTQAKGPLRDLGAYDDSLTDAAVPHPKEPRWCWPPLCSQPFLPRTDSKKSPGL